MQQRLTHFQIRHQCVVWTERNAVVNAFGRRGIKREVLVFGLFLVIRLNLTDEISLTRQQCADTHAVFTGHDHFDAVEVSATLLFKVFRPPVVILAGSQIDFTPQRFFADHKRAGTDDVRGVAQRIKITIQRAQRHQTGANGCRALQESRRGFFEIELHGQRINHFAVVIIVDDFGDRQVMLFVAQTVSIKVFGDRVGIERRAVGEGHARTQFKGVFGFICVE
ncbi:hypothetical protein SRABI106_03064 [Rahnella aquatilis]|nr:hypothetical protein SRABI106_03064 [Rahnella aquatilis]